MIESIDDLWENLSEFSSYYKSDNLEKRDFFEKTIKRGWKYVCAEVDGTLMFCPSRFAGYKNNNMSRHEEKRNRRGDGLDGTKTTAQINRILAQAPNSNQSYEDDFIKLCDSLKIKPHKRVRSYWKISISKNLFRDVGIFKSENEFVDEYGNFVEGAAKQIWTNRYERSASARRTCIKKYGFTCSVCNFDFEKIYGQIGSEYIHVHHIVPLSEHSEEYSINPIRDLRPVCPNCHAMIHTRKPPYTIEEMRQLISVTSS